MNFDEFCLNEDMTKESDQISKNKNWTKNYENISKNSQKMQNFASKSENFEKNQNNNNQNIDEEFVKEHLKKYQNMNSNELLNQLLIEGKKQKNAGNLNSEKLSQIENTFLPMLDEDQRERFKQLVDMLR